MKNLKTYENFNPEEYWEEEEKVVKHIDDLKENEIYVNEFASQLFIFRYKSYEIKNKGNSNEFYKIICYSCLEKHPYGDIFLKDIHFLYYPYSNNDIIRISTDIELKEFLHEEKSDIGDELKKYESFEPEEEWEEEDDVYIEAPSIDFTANKGTKVMIRDDSEYYEQGIMKSGEKKIGIIKNVSLELYKYWVQWYDPLFEKLLSENDYRNIDLLFNI